LELPKPLKNKKGFIYITMGSTGDPKFFFPLIEAFSNMPEFQVVLTTGRSIDKRELPPLPKNIQAYAFLPGSQVAKRARLFICHGGLGTVYQALSQGVPVIGIPFFPDQETMGIGRVEALGAGLTIFPYELTPQKIMLEVKKVLSQESYRNAAKEISSQFELEAGPCRAAEVILQELSKVT